MLKCLPVEPNISREIIQNLEDESYKSGSYNEYLKYKYKRIHINENHLKSAFLRNPESSSQCNSIESILEKRSCQDFIYIRKYLGFSMNFQAV